MTEGRVALDRVRMTRRNMVSLGLAVALGLGASLVVQNLPRPARLVNAAALQRALGDAGSPSVGPPTASTVVMVFSDDQCPVCRADEPALERAMARHPDVRFVFKDWPIFGPRSVYASRVALAAARQGRFAQVREALMRSPRALTAQTVQALAVRAGVDWSEASTALKDPRLAEQLDRHRFEAWSLGLAGTPSYVIGDELHEGRWSEGAFEWAVRAAR